MTNKLISVIVPIYNVELYIDKCIQSLVDQTYTNLEIILVDDGSPDKCPQICEDWAKKDKRIKVIHKINGGLSSARNAGLKVASGDFIGFVDSDDFVDHKMYEYLLGGFTDDSIGITSCLIYKYNNNKITPFQKKWHTDSERIIHYNEFEENVILTKTNFTVWSKLFKSSVIKNVEFRINRLNEDTLFMFDLSQIIIKEKINMKELPYYCYYYRIREGSICNNTIAPLEIEVIRNFDEMANFYKKNNPALSRKIKDAVNVKLIHFVWKLQQTNNVDKKLLSKYTNQFKDIPFNEILRVIFKSKRILRIYIYLIFSNLNQSRNSTHDYKN